MSSKPLGNGISRAEVLGISAEGISLSANSQEMFLAYHDFPWFKNAPPAKVRNVQMPAPDHFFWPDLDVDLTKENILHPEKFPLKAGIG